MCSKQNLFLSIVIAFGLVGCMTPPKPPNCEGAFQPVNPEQHVLLKRLNLDPENTAGAIKAKDVHG